MSAYTVTYTVRVEAENEEDAIQRADEGKGGGHWEAVPAGQPAGASGPGTYSEGAR